VRGWILLIGLTGGLGCSSNHDVHQGTIVGNPGDGMVSLARGADLTYAEATVRDETVLMEACLNNSDETTSPDQILQLVPVGVLEIPSGQWCGMTLLLGDLQVSGWGPDYSTFTLELAPGQVTLNADDFFIWRDSRYLLELGSTDWITADLLDLPGAKDVAVDSTHSLYESLNEAIASGSALYEDLNGNGELDDDEREVALAAGPDHTYAIEDTGSDSQDTGEGDTGLDGDTGLGGDSAALDDSVLLRPSCGGSMSWMFFLPLLAWGRRRDET